MVEVEAKECVGKKVMPQLELVVALKGRLKNPREVKAEVEEEVNKKKRGDSQDCGESGQGSGGGSVLGKKRTIRESEPRAGRKRWRPRRRRWEDDGNKTKKRR